MRQRIVFSRGVKPWTTALMGIALWLGVAMAVAAQPGPSSKLESDWSRLIGDLLPAIRACIDQPAIPVERILKAWPMNQGMVGVRLRSPDGHRFDCMAPQAGGAAERLKGLMPEDGAVPGEGDPVFFPIRENPPPVRVDQLERVVDSSGAVQGWLYYERGGQNDPMERISGMWRLADLGGRGVTGNVAPLLALAADGKLRGEGGCNVMNGTFKLAGDSLTMGRLATTRRACAKAVMDQERRYLDALRRVATWRIDNDRLILADGKGGELMRLTRASR